MAEDENREGKLLVRAIIEILGAPKEHIDNTLRDFVKALKEDKGIEVIREDYAEPKPHEQLFTTFVELEIWFRDLPRLFNFCFEALPSSVEILEPSSLRLDAAHLSDYLNDLQSRLHTLDMSLKNLRSEHQLLRKNADALFNNLVGLSLKEGPKDITKISKDLGIKEEELRPLLEQLVKTGYLRVKDGQYSMDKKGG